MCAAPVPFAKAIRDGPTPRHTRQTAQEGDSMSRRLTVALAAAVLFTSTTAAAWEPSIIGLDDETIVTGASPATDTSAALTAYAAGAKVTPEMVSEAAVAGDAVAETAAPSSPVLFAGAAARVTPEMVSEAAVADDAAEAAQALVASTPAAKDMPELGSGAAREDTEPSATLTPTSAR
jgi:hypothetical protein